LDDWRTLSSLKGGVERMGYDNSPDQKFDFEMNRIGGYSKFFNNYKIYKKNIVCLENTAKHWHKNILEYKKN